MEKSELQAIIDSTPELDMDFDGGRGTRYRTCLALQLLILYEETQAVVKDHRKTETFSFVLTV